MYWKRKKYVLETKVLRGRGCSFRTLLPLILSFNLFRAYSRYPLSTLFFLMPCLKFRRTSFLRSTFKLYDIHVSLGKSFSFIHLFLFCFYKTAFVRNTDSLKREVIKS